MRPLKTGENPPANSKSSNEICESMGAKLPFIGTKQKATAISKFAKDATGYGHPIFYITESSTNAVPTCQKLLPFTVRNETVMNGGYICMHFIPANVAPVLICERSCDEMDFRGTV
ncbi:unnamed protein product [Enterobius vermicularis]|uniref:AcnX domain-containing protein n=1 Tax=Enterobius vermicularis TaxID=51028 RepID=A0A0N4VNJ6_ENTVE|nr:unnamed protein product [Enterobius vermicularis]